MTKDDIIRMARDAEFGEFVNMITNPLERFANLVAEKVRGQTIESEKAGWLYALDKAVKEEREACAKVCESYQDAVDRHKWPNGYECAAAIRARKEK